jgi:hypothetical protein
MERSGEQWIAQAAERFGDPPLAVPAAAEEQEKASEFDGKSVAELLSIVTSMIRDGETATGALRRLGAAMPRRKWQRKRKGAPAAAPAADAGNAKAEFDRLTDVTSELTMRGLPTVYTQTRAALLRDAARRRGTG